MPRLFISPDGELSGIYADDLDYRSLAAALGGDLSITRASHVEPTAAGAWEADMAPSGGPVLGPFPTRAEALAREVEWLGARMEGREPCPS